MKNFAGLVKFTKSNDAIIGGLMVLYLVLDCCEMPGMVNDVVNSNLGAGVLMISALVLFLKVGNPVLLVLGLLCVYELMARAKKSYRSRNIPSIVTSSNPKRSFKQSSNFGYSFQEGFKEGDKMEEKPEAEAEAEAGFTGVEGLNSASSISHSSIN